MGNSPGTSPDQEKTKSKSRWIGAAVVLVVLALLIWPIRKIFFENPPVPSATSVVDPDPLCGWVSGELKLKCVVGLAAEGVLGPGHFVAYSSQEGSAAKVPFPNGDLFSSTCLVPGARVDELLADLKGQEQQNEIVMAEITYKLNRIFKAGAELPVPRLADMTLKAGPKMTEVQNIRLTAPHAWIKIVDENKFLDLLSHAAIQQECIDRLIAKKYSVVSKAAIAKDFDVTVTDSSGHSFGLSAAAAHDQITVNAGGEASSTIDESIKKASASAVVVGVDFFDSDIFSQHRAQLTAPIFLPSGTTRMDVRAGFGGIIFGRRSSFAPLGMGAMLDAKWQPNFIGSGSNSCTFDKNNWSSAALVSLQKPVQIDPHSQTVNFTTSGTMTGGALLGTVDARPGCNVIQLNTVLAEIKFDSDIKTIVRTTGNFTLTVDVSGLSHLEILEVRDWTGRQVQRRLKSGTSNESGKEGPFEFTVAGPAVYDVHVVGARSFSAHGTSPLQLDDQGSFVVTVH